MQKMNLVLLVLTLCACLVLTVGAEGGNYGEDIEFGTTAPEATTEDTSEQSSEAVSEQTTESATEETTEESTGTEQGTEQGTEETTEESTAEQGGEQTTEPEESVTDAETTEPAESVTDAQTEKPDEQKTEQETQSEPAPGLPLSLILVVLGVFGVGCVVVAVIVMIKFTRAHK